MIFVIVTALLVTLVRAQLHKSINDFFINSINQAESTWTAFRNFPPNTSNEYLEKLVGNRGAISPEDSKLKLLYYKTGYYENFFFQDLFDAREKWPNCKDVINTVAKQENCDGWAFAVASVISDRQCIRSQGNQKVIRSAEDIVSCCKNCKSVDTAFGRSINTNVWNFWIQEGVVSGGYNGCIPYNNSKVCRTHCTNENYTTSYNLDKGFGSIKYKLPKDALQIQIDLFLYGPVAAEFEVYSDFLNYKDGRYMGNHVVKIVGWGSELGRPFWICANSWGENWGSMNGFFKILKGVDHCGIESNVMAGRVDKKITKREFYLQGNCGAVKVSWFLCAFCFILMFE